MKSLNEKELFSTLIAEAEKAAFSGWDFSYIVRTGRQTDGALPWSYGTEVLRWIKSSKSTLDMGTGGGELLSILATLPKNTCATEAYGPNVNVARRRLKPLGVKVFRIKELQPLPFKNGQFDLIINRHTYYSEKEVFRMLKHGGVFITQQIGDLSFLLICAIRKVHCSIFSRKSHQAATVSL